MPLDRAVPWPMPDKADCHFYHSMDFPDGDSVTGHWDIRGRFDQYIGHYPIRGKSVLDVGTATGFVAFSAESAGATVTATDLKHASEISLLPFKEHQYQSGNILDFERGVEEDWKRIKNAFWFAWHKYGSKVSMSYTPVRKLRYTDERFDVVIAGAILEHLSDPVSAIGAFGRLAKEAVIIPMTPVLPTDELLMRPITTLANPVTRPTTSSSPSVLPSIAVLGNPAEYFTWWALSRGLYRRIFANMGFEIEFVPATAYNVELKIDATDRWTIVARRAEDIALDEMPPALTGQAEAESAAKAASIQEAYASAIAKIAALQASTSWRLTRPLRAVSQLMRGHVGLALMEVGIPRHHIEHLKNIITRRVGPKAQSQFPEA